MSANHMFWSAELFIRHWLPNIWTDNNINTSLLWFAPRLPLFPCKVSNSNSIRLQSCEFPWWAAVGATWSTHSSQLEIFAISQVFTPLAAHGRYDRTISLRGSAMFLPVWTGREGGRGPAGSAEVFSEAFKHILAAFCLTIFHCTIWTAKRFNALRWSIITDNLTQLCTHRDPIQLSNRPYFSKPIK